MNAEEARKLTATQLKGPVTAHLMEIVYDKIKAAAEAGRDSITEPFHGLRTPVSHLQAESVWSQLRQAGYKVDHRPDPDPGHPCSHPYTEISW